MTRKAGARPAGTEVAVDGIQAGPADSGTGGGTDSGTDSELDRLRAEVARLAAELDGERRVAAARLDEVAAVRRELAAEFDRLGSALTAQRKETEVRLARLRIAHRDALAAERAALVKAYERRIGFRVERKVRRLLSPARQGLGPVRQGLAPVRRGIGRRLPKPVRSVLRRVLRRGAR